MFCNFGCQRYSCLDFFFFFSYFQALESSPQPQQQVEPDPCSSEYGGSSWDDLSDADAFSDDEVISAFYAS